VPQRGQEKSDRREDPIFSTTAIRRRHSPDSCRRCRRDDAPARARRDPAVRRYALSAGSSGTQLLEIGCGNGLLLSACEPSFRRWISRVVTTRPRWWSWRAHERSNAVSSAGRRARAHLRRRRVRRDRVGRCLINVLDRPARTVVTRAPPRAASGGHFVLIEAFPKGSTIQPSARRAGARAERRPAPQPLVRLRVFTAAIDGLFEPVVDLGGIRIRTPTPRARRTTSCRRTTSSRASCIPPSRVERCCTTRSS